MTARLFAVGFLAALMITVVHAQQAAESRPAADTSEAAAASEAEPAATPQHGNTQSAQPDAAKASQPTPASEASSEDAATDAAPIEAAPAAPAFDAMKASRKELEEYNKTVADGDRIICKKPTANHSGSRMAKRECHTAAQWRVIEK